MIAHVRGVVVQRGADSVVVDVNGLGYLVRVPASADVPARGQEVELSTSMVVREDSMTLYGFTDPAARELFELLMGASGVGPSSRSRSCRPTARPSSPGRSRWATSTCSSPCPASARSRPVGSSWS